MHIRGSITALITPFTDSGALDIPAWRELIKGQLAAGTQGVVVAGSTGEAAMLSEAEFGELIRTAVEEVQGRVPVLAGAGQSGTDRTIEQCRRARAAGSDALLVAAPAYVRPTQAGLRCHFEAVATALDIPLVLYNVPSRTAVDLLPETVAQLAKNPAIIGIKEAVADPQRMAQLLALRSADFAVLSGDDGSACRAILDGADGVISVASNLIPAAFRQLSDAARAGDAATAQDLDAHLDGLYQALSLEPNPIPIKALMALAGRCHNRLRLPLLPLSSPFVPQVTAVLEQVRRIEARLQPAQAA
ncbi:MAG TPA: 4-hydroxy-tetrahydrodipicolinate synthase [Chiayiivirga sp.]|nr:4-hydroxy-tetrahydrodipicolinate synthase [Chiayiivirga sp.]